MKNYTLTIAAFIVSTAAEAQNVGIGEANPTESKLQVRAVDSAALLIHNPATALNTKTALFYKNDNAYSGSIATIQTAPGYYRMGMFTYGSGSPSGLVERVSILDGGNVGIGTTNPGAKLEIAGTVKIADGTQGVKKVLTSDAAGNASWEEPAAAAPGGNIGYGTWGDCSTNGISEYNPVTDPQGQLGDLFGYSTAISGNFAIVGEPLDAVGANSFQGSALVYFFNGTSWVFQQRLTDPGGVAGDQFGFGVAINGNTIMVGANGDQVGSNFNQGSVCVFNYNGSSWVYGQKLVDPNGAADEQFGIRISISGNAAIVGNPRSDINALNAGTVTFFERVGTVWAFKQRFINPTPAQNDQFGISVSISGNYAVVGVPYDDVVTTDMGSAVVYIYNGSTWAFLQTIMPDDNSGGLGANYLYGNSVSISGNNLVIGIPGYFSGLGALAFYKLSGSTIQYSQRFFGQISNTSRLGTRVHVSGNYLMASAPGEPNPASVNPNSDKGSLTIYVSIGTAWQFVQRFYGKSNDENVTFGDMFEIEGTTKRFIIGTSAFGQSRGKVEFGKVN